MSLLEIFSTTHNVDTSSLHQDDFRMWAHDVINALYTRPEAGGRTAQLAAKWRQSNAKVMHESYRTKPKTHDDLVSLEIL